jgi:hypothetical protein
MSTPPLQTAILVSRDLMLSSALAGPARQHGWALSVSASWSGLQDAIANAQAAQAPARLALIDLSLHDFQLSPDQIAWLHARSIETVAFGPHVHRERLVAAQAAGCRRVWSRGQLHQQADELFAGSCTPAELPPADAGE